MKAICKTKTIITYKKNSIVLLIFLSKKKKNQMNNKTNYIANAW